MLKHPTSTIKTTVILILATLVSTAVFATGATIAYPSGIKLGGAAGYNGKANVANSPYWQANDYYNMKSNEHLSILSNFETYQQTTEYTCGPASAVMVLNHFGVTSNELAIAAAAGTTAAAGSNTQQLVNYFKSMGWKVESSLSVKPTPTLKLFRDYISAGKPVLVEWVDWGGHWEVAIGYDTMGTPNESDDVIIFADPYDISDHLQDGYYTYSAERFYYMWMLSSHTTDPENMRDKQWIVATPQ